MHAVFNFDARPRVIGRGHQVAGLGLQFVAGIRALPIYIFMELTVSPIGTLRLLEV